MNLLTLYSLSGRSIVYCFSILFILIGCTGAEKKQEEKSVEHGLLAADNCTYKVNAEQQQVIRQTLAYIQEHVVLRDYCRADYNPGQVCDTDENIQWICANIYDDLRIYLKNHPTITYCMSTSFGKDWLAAVDLNFSDRHIYFSKRFFEVDQEEQRRTLIHELYHLQGNNREHRSEKDCEYYRDWSLKAEHCLTCTATLTPMHLSSCKGKNGLFILQ